MIVKSPKKKSGNINIKLPNKDGNSDIIEKKDHIKYLGVLLDEKLSWKHHIAYVCSRLARNTGIFSMLMIFSHNTTYAGNKNFYKPRTRTNIGKQSVSSIVVDLWQGLPTSLKNLNTFTFPGKVKEFLLKTQSSK